MARRPNRQAWYCICALTSLAFPFSRPAFAVELPKVDAVDPGPPVKLPPITDYLDGPLRSGSAPAGAAGEAVAAQDPAVPALDAIEQAWQQEGGVEGVDPETDGFDPEAIDLSGQDLSEQVCISAGAASRGRLIYGIPMPTTPGILVRAERNNTYGTPETIAALRYAVARVLQKFPESHDLVLGDISRVGGGKLRPHSSHQSGRDVDIGFYHKGVGQPRGLVAANAENLDLERTWIFLEALMEDNKVEYIFIDHGVQKLLYNYVKYTLGAPQSYLDTVFTYPRKRPRAIISHAPGHRNHIHVRFWSPIAVAAGHGVDLRPRDGEEIPAEQMKEYKRGCYVALNTLERFDWGTPPRTEIVKQWREVQVAYKVKSGDTLSGIAKKHDVSVAELLRWNKKLSKTSKLKPGQAVAVYAKQQVEIEVPVDGISSDVMVARASAPTGKGEPQWAGTGPIADLEVEETEVDDENHVEPPPSQAVANVRAALAKERAAEYREVERTVWHAIHNGDNLWSIARKHNTTVDQLCELNGLSRDARLRPGQRLKVKVVHERVHVPSDKATVQNDGRSGRKGG